MSGKSRNGPVRVIAQFRDRAIPLEKTPAAPDEGLSSTKSSSEEPRPQNDSGTPNAPPACESDPTNP